MRRVVDRLDRREAGHTDEDDAEQDRRDAVAQRFEALVGNRNRPDQTGHIVSPSPSTRGHKRGPIAGRSPGSRVDVLSRPSRSNQTLQWVIAEDSPLTVAGAATASSALSPCSLLHPAGAGTNDAVTIATVNTNAQGPALRH